MERRKAIRKGLVFGMVLALVAILFVGVPMNVSADSTIYIDEFGNIIPSTAPITRVGDVYTLTANVYETIIIQKSGITLDGDGYSIIKGSGFNGVYVRDQTDVTIKNLNINGFYHGIALYYSNDCTISGNKVTGSSNSGIYLSHSGGSTLSENSMSSNRYNFHVDGTDHYKYNVDNTNTVEGKPILYSVDEENVVYDGDVDGDYGVVYVINGNDVTVKNMELSLNNYYSVYFFDCTDSTIENIEVSSSLYGIYLHYSENSMIKGCTVTNCKYEGIYLTSSSDSTVSGNDVSSCDKGIYIMRSSSSTITGNTATSNDYGIYLYSCGSSTLTGNTATGNKDSGISLSYSSSCTLTSNTATDNTDNLGIGLWKSGSCTLTGNIAKGNKYGIDILNSASCTLRNNIMAGNNHNFGIRAYSLAEYTQDIDTSNTVDGKPIYYWVDQSHKTVPSDAGYVGIIDSNYITVKDLTISKNIQGVLFAYTTDSVIKNMEIADNIWGIYLANSEDNIVSSNTVSDSYVYDIYLYYSSGSKVTGNMVSGGRYGIYLVVSGDSSVNENKVMENSQYGIYLSGSSDCWVTGNTVSDGYTGIYIGSSDSNKLIRNDVTANSYIGIYFSSSDFGTITGNLVKDNSIIGIFVYNSDFNKMTSNTLTENGKGIQFSYSDDNIIFHNNFIDNSIQVYNYLSTNAWNNDKNEGNYWCDYEGFDDGSNGRSAGDGIGDTDLPHQSVDNYPLMDPWGEPEDRIEDLIDEVEDMDLPKGTENSLVSKLENAIKSVEKENYNLAVNQLNAFINEVKAQSGKKLTEEQVDELIAAAQLIIYIITA